MEVKLYHEPSDLFVHAVKKKFDELKKRYKGTLITEEMMIPHEIPITKTIVLDIDCMAEYQLYDRKMAQGGIFLHHDRMWYYYILQWLDEITGNQDKAGGIILLATVKSDLELKKSVGLPENMTTGEAMQELGKMKSDYKVIERNKTENQVEIANIRMLLGTRLLKPYAETTENHVVFMEETEIAKIERRQKKDEDQELSRDEFSSALNTPYGRQTKTNREPLNFSILMVFLLNEFVYNFDIPSFHFLFSL